MVGADKDGPPRGGGAPAAAGPGLSLTRLLASPAGKSRRRGRDAGRERPQPHRGLSAAPRRREGRSGLPEPGYGERVPAEARWKPPAPGSGRAGTLGKLGRKVNAHFHFCVWGEEN